MNYTRRIFLAGLLTASFALLWAYGIELIWLGAILAVGLGFLGWLGQYQQKWSWTINLFLVGMVILVMIGVLLRLRLYLLLPAILGALAAWDLGRFQQRMEETPVSESVQNIEKRHLGMLALALGSGGIFAGVVLTTRMQISFGIALALGVILIISLVQIYRFWVNSGAIRG